MTSINLPPVRAVPGHCRDTAGERSCNRTHASVFCMSLRASAHTGVAIRSPFGSTKREAVPKAIPQPSTNSPKQQPTCQIFLRGADCHTSDIGHWCGNDIHKFAACPQVPEPAAKCRLCSRPLSRLFPQILHSGQAGLGPLAHCLGHLEQAPGAVPGGKQARHIGGHGPIHGNLPVLGEQ